MIASCLRRYRIGNFGPTAFWQFDPELSLAEAKVQRRFVSEPNLKWSIDARCDGERDRMFVETAHRVVDNPFNSDRIRAGQAQPIDKNGAQKEKVEQTDQSQQRFEPKGKQDEQDAKSQQRPGSRKKDHPSGRGGWLPPLCRSPTSLSEAS